MIDKKLLIFLIAVIVVGGYGIYANNKPSAPSGNIVATEDFVEIPLSDISEEMKVYSFDSNGVEVKYLVMLGSDGEVRTGFDACDVCGGHKGYRQEGDQVVCNNCGLKFNIDDIGTKNTPGGCWPSSLNHKIEGDKVLISTTELANGAYRFA